MPLQGESLLDPEESLQPVFVFARIRTVASIFGWPAEANCG
jgi:hypothetical protein